MAKETTTPVANAAEEALLNEEVQSTNVENNEEQADDFASIVKELKRGANSKRYTRKVTNVLVSEKDTYTRVTFVVDKAVRAFDADGEETISKNVFASSISISGVLKQDEELSWLAAAVANGTLPMNLIFNGATIEIVQEYVAEGTSYANPFSQREPEVVDHDMFINHIVDIKLGKTGSRFADRYADKLLEAAL